MDTLTVTEDGIEVPEPYQDSEKIVIRTPQNTIDMSSGFQAIYSGGRFALVTPEDFREQDEYFNAGLAPDTVSFKEYGEDATKYRVETK